MEPYLLIIRHPYEEPYHLNLLVAASNGRQRSELEVYAATDDLVRLSRRLREFPGQSRSEVLWELGSERPEDRFAFYFRMRALQVDATGQCALEVHCCNNREPPDRELSEFSILAMPSDLDRLANLLERFAELNHKVLEWRITDGELRQDA